jgi:hypothetical protein
MGPPDEFHEFGSIDLPRVLPLDRGGEEAMTQRQSCDFQCLGVLEKG